MKDTHIAYLWLGGWLSVAVVIGVLVGLKTLDHGGPLWAAALSGAYFGFWGAWVVGLAVHRILRR